jgi:hypothetical protein
MPGRSEMFLKKLCVRQSRKPGSGCQGRRGHLRVAKFCNHFFKYNRVMFFPADAGIPVAKRKNKILSGNNGMGNVTRLKPVTAGGANLFYQATWGALYFFNLFI